jgi:hypothetical protein
LRGSALGAAAGFASSFLPQATRAAAATKEIAAILRIDRLFRIVMKFPLGGGLGWTKKTL